MYYYLIIALQGYCIYHCYIHKNAFYWFLVILLLPLLGCILYLLTHVVQKRNIEKVQHEFAHALNPGKKISDLEQKLEFSETFENRVALADAYLAEGHYDRAEMEYKAALTGTFKDDFYVGSKLIETYYGSSQFEKVITEVEGLMSSPKFKRSNVSFLYALALEKQGDLELAEEYLRSFNAPYSKYRERLELAGFYLRNDLKNKAKEILMDIDQESNGMSKTSYRQHRTYIDKAKELLKSNF